MRIRVLPQHLTITGALALALCLLALLAAGSERAYAQVEDHRAGEVIVKLRDDPLVPGPPRIEDINTVYGTTTLDRYFESEDVYLLRKPDTPETVEEFAQRLEQDTARILYAQPNFLAETPEGAARMRARPDNGPGELSKQYAVESFGLSSCTALPNRPGRNVKVAVLDTGVQLHHPRLEANFKGVKRYDFVEDDGKPADSRAGLDVDGDGETDELAGHGTHVAGIVDLVAPSAKIMPVRVLDSEGYGDVFTISKAVSFAQLNGADVINLSLGGSRKSDLLKEVIDNAIENGVVVVAAAGNSNRSAPPHYPAAGNGTTAAVEGLLAVTSVDGEEKKSNFANFGVWVDISAPGEDIRSAFLDSKYANWSGTSMATPFVSGQAAIIRQVHGETVLARSLETKIRSTARDISSKNPGYLLQLGAGHADVCASLSDP